MSSGQLSSLQRSIERRRADEAAVAAASRKRIEERNKLANASIASKFGGGGEDVAPLPQAKKYGLVTLDELKEERADDSSKRKRVAAAPPPASKKKRKRRKKVNGAAVVPPAVILSFGGDDGGGDDHDLRESGSTNGGEGPLSAPPPPSSAVVAAPTGAAGSGASAAGAAGAGARKKVVKNPTVNTEFLPDAERDAAEAAERERIAAEWMAEQEKIKAEKIEVVYSYWDGGGHRASVTVTKGTTIRKFLSIVKNEFEGIRFTSPDQLIYVKEDVIIPHHFTFYDLIATKARGKSGPLFQFGVHDDVRLLHDASVETDESHAGKVMLRRLYESSKHIFPYSRWEVYDPTKDYGGRYTIRD